MGNRQTQEQQQGIRQFPGAPLPDDDLIEADEPQSGGDRQSEERSAAADPADIEDADIDDDDDAEDDADDESDVDDEEEDGSGGHV